MIPFNEGVSKNIEKGDLLLMIWERGISNLQSSSLLIIDTTESVNGPA